MTKTHPNQSRGILISLTILKNTCLFAAFPYMNLFTRTRKTLRRLSEEKNRDSRRRGRETDLYLLKIFFCVKTIETLCNFPIFPNAPDERNVALRTEILIENFRNVHDGRRLLGFLLPNLTGDYHFASVTNGFAEI